MTPNEARKFRSVVAIVFANQDYFRQNEDASLFEQGMRPQEGFEPAAITYDGCVRFYKENPKKVDVLYEKYLSQKARNDIKTWRSQEQIKIDKLKESYDASVTTKEPNNDNLEKNHDERLAEIHEKHLKEARGVAAMAYINLAYLQRKREKFLPPNAENASYEEYIAHYGKHPEQVSALWQKNKDEQASIDRWNKDNIQEHQARWKIVAKKELIERLSDPNNENLKPGGGGPSRLFNAEPIEEVLCPYEGRAALDNFLSIAQKNNRMEEATAQTVHQFAQLTETRFGDGLLDEVVTEIREKHAKQYSSILSGNYLQHGVNEAHAPEILKKDLAASFLQPLGNYADPKPGILLGSKIAAKQIAYSRYNDIFQSHAKQQITTSNTTFLQAAKNIQNAPQDYQYIQEGDTTQADMDEMFLARNQLKSETFLRPPLWSRIKDMIQSWILTVSDVFSNISWPSWNWGNKTKKQGYSPVASSDPLDSTSENNTRLSQRDTDVTSPLPKYVQSVDLSNHPSNIPASPRSVADIHSGELHYPAATLIGALDTELHKQAVKKEQDLASVHGEQPPAQASESSSHAPINTTQKAFFPHEKNIQTNVPQHKQIPS